MTQTETLELLVATLQQANSSQSESIERLTRQNEQLQNKLQELLAQVAWLNRQLFGRKSEKLAHLDPNQLSQFDPPVQPLKYRKKPQPKNLSARRLPKRKCGRTATCWMAFL